MKPRWEVWQTKTENHIIPTLDWMTHSRSRQCACSPYVDSHLNPVAVIHHSADLREYSEPDHIPGLYEGKEN